VAVLARVDRIRLIFQPIHNETHRPNPRELLVSCGQGEGSPEGFYLRMGFKHDGKMYGDEIGLSLSLED